MFAKIMKVLLPSIATTAGKHVIAMAVVSLFRTGINDSIARIQGKLFRAVFLRDTPSTQIHHHCGLLIILLC